MILLNGTAIPMQPSSLDEDPTQIKTDQSSVSGKISRTVNEKVAKVKMSWKFVDRDLVEWFRNLYDAFEPVEYQNADSVFGAKYTNGFTGILEYSGGEYIRGGSYFTPLSVTIYEGTVYPDEPGE